MKERPILFSAPMVRAILSGTKTQTRRVVKARKCPDFGCHMASNEIAGDEHPERLCPYGQPGERLWVRESFHDATTAAAGRVLYRASGDVACGWTPSIHMPRRLSRILLEVTSVRVERLQVVGEVDCISEGAPGGHGSIPGYPYAATPMEHYRHIWESINGAGSWAANPWVWAIEFKLATSPLGGARHA